MVTVQPDVANKHGATRANTVLLTVIDYCLATDSVGKTQRIKEVVEGAVPDRDTQSIGKWSPS